MPNYIDRSIRARDDLLYYNLEGDMYAERAFIRGDDLALLRRITKAGLTDARDLAIERALMRGRGYREIAKAAGCDVAQVEQVMSAVHSLIGV